MPAANQRPRRAGNLCGGVRVDTNARFPGIPGARGLAFGLEIEQIHMMGVIFGSPRARAPLGEGTPACTAWNVAAPF